MPHRPLARLALTAIILAAGLPAAADTALPPFLTVGRADHGSTWTLSLGHDAPFHQTSRPVTNQRLIPVPGTATSLLLWDEKDGRKTESMYAVTRDGRTIAGRPRPAPTTVHLKFADFDPRSRLPLVPAALTAPADSAVGLVQFVAPPLPEMRDQVVAAGGEVLGFLPDCVYMVRMDAPARARVAALPFVRWVGPMHTGYKLEDRLTRRMAQQGLLGGQARAGAPLRVNIQCFRRGPADQATVGAAVGAAGGSVVAEVPQGFIIQAALTPAQILAVARLDEVAYIDQWTAPEDDMNHARAPEGSDADYVESALGFTGQGVRGEVMDFGFRKTHSAFKTPDPLLHGPEAGANDSHGTSTFGIVFGTGAGNPAGRGMLPGREQGIFASYLNLKENFGTITRYDHTAELVDPDGPFRAVFQSNSWGSQATTQYTTMSAELDDILFTFDILTVNSMSNNGNRSARPQAWSKNVVSVGGLNHFNNAVRADDDWDFGSSIGPAADGRIKPDLAHYFDSVLCTTGANDSAYTSSFGGTSAATPITAGAFGLMFQMWHEGVFAGFGGGPSVFDDRPAMSTAKALLINSAFRYDFAGPDADLARIHQGWGMANLRNLYDRRHRTFIVNESDPLAPLDAAVYTLRVQPGEPSLLATLVYTDPAGQPGADIARVNDLSLRLTSPDGQAVYWGNSGLLDGNWSTPGGQSNTLDTVENVFVQSPAPGDWTVEVLADEVVQDAHTETPDSIDADFALVVAGAARVACYPDFTADGALDLFDFLAYVNAFYAQDPAADCTADGALDLFDFLCFVNAFNAGC
jgi:hypothetical protein